MGSLAGRVFDEGLRWGSSRRRSQLRFGSRVCIQTVDLSLLRVEPAEDQQVIGRSREVDSFSIFVVVEPTDPGRTKLGRRVRVGSEVAFRSFSGGFIGCDFNNQDVLTCHASQVRGWEIFTIRPGVGKAAPDGLFVDYGRPVFLHLKGPAGEPRVLTYRKETSQRCRGRELAVSTWETFSLFDPESLIVAGR